jgi:hypothetical protein
MKVVYNHGEKQWLCVNISRDKSYHTHVQFNFKKAAQAIVICAYEGAIPPDYPYWMVESVNRIWFGKDFMERTDVCNENLHTNKPSIRFPKKNKKKKSYNNGYVNRTKVIREKG